MPNRLQIGFYNDESIMDDRQPTGRDFCEALLQMFGSMPDVNAVYDLSTEQRAAAQQVYDGLMRFITLPDSELKNLDAKCQGLLNEFESTPVDSYPIISRL